MPRRRALLVGINYSGTSHALSGCINDAVNVSELLRENGYTEITILADDGSHMSPTRKNMLGAMVKFVCDTKRGDCVFFHYSGHGTSTYDRDGDEVDGRDEALCPLGGGVITDDELRQVFVDRMPAGVSMNMLLDCCHSGTGSDLRHNYEDVSRCMVGGRMPDEYAPHQWTHAHKGRESKKRADVQCRVVCVSGCSDSQTSADTVFDREACGAMTAAFLKAWKHHSSKKSASLQEVFQYMNCMLRCCRYGQRPQLSIGDIDTAKDYESGIARMML